MQQPFSQRLPENLVQPDDDAQLPEPKVFMVGTCAWLLLLCIPDVNSLKISVFISIFLILANFSRSVIHLIYPPREVLVKLNLLQFLLFLFLNYQLYRSFGAHHYEFESPPNLLHWLQLTFAHTLRAADVIDGLEGYNIDLQSIEPVTRFSSSMLVLFHVCTDIFLVSFLVTRLKFNMMSRQQVTQEPSEFVIWLKENYLRLAVALLSLGLVCTLGLAVFYQWNPPDLLLFPIDQFFRAADFPDAMNLYQIQLHGSEASFLTDTVGIMLRISFTVLISEWIARFFPALFVSVDALILLLHSQIDSQKLTAVKKLGELGSEVERAIPFLVPLLVDDNPEIRLATRDALREIQPRWIDNPSCSHAVPGLVLGLVHEDERAQSIARKTLAKLDPNWNRRDDVRALLPVFIESLFDDSRTVSRAAKQVLQQIHPRWPKLIECQENIPWLITQLTSERAANRRLAEQLLSKIDPEWRSSETGHPAVNLLIDIIREGDDAQLARTLGVLSEMALTQSQQRKIQNATEKTLIQKEKEEYEAEHPILSQIDNGFNFVHTLFVILGTCILIWAIIDSRK